MKQDISLSTFLMSYGVKGVTERSIKMTSTGIVDNRFVIGVSADAIRGDVMKDILRQLNAPEEAQMQIQKRLHEASTVGFGQEGNWDQCSRRVYLEYWGRLQQDQFAADAEDNQEGIIIDAEEKNIRNEPQHVMDSWKWQSQDRTRWHTSRYSVFTKATNRENCDEFTRFVERIFDDKFLVVYLSTLLRGLNEAQSIRKYTQLWSTIDVDQQGRLLGRQTLDLNILDYEIQAKELGQILIALSLVLPVRQSQINQYLDHWSHSNAVVSHIAAGTDQVGGKYFCIYTI